MRRARTAQDLTPNRAVGFNASEFAVGTNDQQFLVIRSRDQGQGLVLVEHWFNDLTRESRP